MEIERRATDHSENIARWRSAAAATRAARGVRRSSLNSRAFSMAMTAWSANVCQQLDLLVGERPHLGACQPKSPNRNAVPQHRNAEISAKAPKSLRFRPDILGVSLHIGNMNNLPFK